MEYYEIALKKPFKENEVLWRDGYGKNGKALAYVTARTCQTRLDRTFTPAGWQVSYDYLGERMICTVSCHIKGNWISKSDGAGDTNIEGWKVTFKIKDPWPPASTQIYRVVTTKKKVVVGASEELAIGVVPSVKSRTVFLNSPANVTKADGKRVVIKAKMRPKKKGLKVWGQVLVSGDPATGEWRTIRKTRTKAKGKIVFKVKKKEVPPVGVTYVYRLLVVDDRQAAGVSPLVTVTVR